MRATPQSLRADLDALGLRPGDLVMVHASVRAVGPVYGGPDEIHRAIVDTASPGGAMTMLLGCPDGYDEIGRGRLPEDEIARLRAHLPAFDPQATRAERENGTLAEFFRTWPGTLVSPCVSARMGARGDRAEWLMAEHPLMFPFGAGTPFEKLAQHGGKIMLIGSDRDQVTLMHYVEHLTDFPDKRFVHYEVPVLRNGERVWALCAEVDSSSAGAHANWPDRFFALLVDDFIAQHDGTAVCFHGKVGNAETWLLDAAALVRHAAPIMVQTANGEPYFDAPPMGGDT
ncbi:MAG TPA: AAC(3) family N-acetyltransferase [Rhizomicrobium sp.]|jgi:aminoglycoside 3-N-acetyltransferase